MLSKRALQKASFSSTPAANSLRRVYKIPGKNINVASHNEERRAE